MPKSKYDKIYFTLKQRIETEVYEYQQLLPSENTLVQEFSCSRNTIRRAIQALLADGYVQALKGKGVRVIFQKTGHSHFLLSGIESFPEAAARNAVRQHTKVIHFEERLTDAKLSKKTGIPEGSPIYYIQRVRFLDDIPLILDHNYFVREATEGLTKEIAEQSVYQYLENQLNMVITTTRRVITVEPVTELDERNLELNGCNCVAVVSNSTFNSDGIMFEFTQSRHSPKHFEFHDIAQRNKYTSL